MRRLLAFFITVATSATGIVTAATAAPANAAVYTPPALRQRVDLNAGWKFIRSDVPGAQTPGFDDASWSTVSTPHTWNAVDGADGGGNYYRGVGWYRRHYTVPAGYAGRQLYLQFDGVDQVADVYVNGVLLGEHRGGYARFRFNATAALRPGQDNVIAVKVTNADDDTIAPQTADYTFYGGIYRQVGLYAVDPLQIRMLDYAGPGVYLRQRTVTAASATVDVTAKLFNNLGSPRTVAVRAVVTDATGTVVADRTRTGVTLGAHAGGDVVQTLTIANPHRWDGAADPYLYHATVELRDTAAGRVSDVVTEPLGLRSFAIDASAGFSLNGHHVQLHGVNLHQDTAGAGWAETDADHTRDFDLISEIGANAVRLAHYQHDQPDYTLADQRGLVTWAEIPLVNDTNPGKAFADNARAQMLELIRQNYNHPSIIFWGIGNEQRVNNAATNDLLSSLNSLVATEDPDRISTYATCCVSDTGPVATHARTTGYNKYYGWYGGTASDLGPALDRLHAALPTRPIAVSEYGAGANVAQHSLDPTPPAPGGQFHPEEYQAALHEASWRQLAARPYIWGTFVWNMFDFASDGRNEGAQPGINDKGLVTRDRAVKKDAFFWYKVNWNPTPTLYITSRRWTARTDPATQVKIYSNATEVTLTLNGTSLGARSSTNHIFTWTGVTLRPGPNTVVATAVIGGRTVSDQVTWTLS
jgi:beta-galactosidase